MLTRPQPETTLVTRERVLWLAIRQALLIMLAAIEVHLDMERTRETRLDRKERERAV